MGHAAPVVRRAHLAPPRHASSSPLLARFHWERPMGLYSHLEATDPEIAAIIKREERRQFTGIELIASENQVNAAVYLALLQPGDTVLGMALDQGGHLTHGAKVNFSGKLYNFIPYGVSP